MGVGMMTQAEFSQKLAEMRQREELLKYQQQQQTMRALTTGPTAALMLKEGIGTQKEHDAAKAMAGIPELAPYAPLVGAGVNPKAIGAFGETSSLKKEREASAREHEANADFTGQGRNRPDTEDKANDHARQVAMAQAYKVWKTKYGMPGGVQLPSDPTAAAAVLSQLRMSNDPSVPLFTDWLDSDEGANVFNSSYQLLRPGKATMLIAPTNSRGGKKVDVQAKLNDLVNSFGDVGAKTPTSAMTPNPNETATPARQPSGAATATPPARKMSAQDILAATGF
jgi:hypothetical protein